MILDPLKLDYASSSLVDPAGRVFFHENRVFRLVISDDSAKLYKALLQMPEIERFFTAGLVRSWIPADITVQDAALVIEHEFIQFESHPAEFTDAMHWQAACCLVRLAKALSEFGLTLKDAHPRNIMFYRGSPVFIDFGSISKGTGVSRLWIEEFYLCFAVPIRIAASRFQRLAHEYRREHRAGFGLNLMKYPWLRKWVWFRLPSNIKSERLLDWLESWLKKHQPAKSEVGRWSNYEQAHGAIAEGKPQTEKQFFVSKALSEQRPSTVLDCAANNGFYALMAARSGARVAAFDYEERCVNEVLMQASTTKADITPALMDFLEPTAPSGLGLRCLSAFERFRSDMVLALGLVHHVCLGQGLPLSLFCESCVRFARKDILVEFVHTSDLHISNWPIPANMTFSQDELEQQFSRLGWHKYAQADIKRDGIDRSLLHFQPTAR